MTETKLVTMIADVPMATVENQADSQAGRLPTAAPTRPVTIAAPANPTISASLPAPTMQPPKRTPPRQRVTKRTKRLSEGNESSEFEGTMSCIEEPKKRPYKTKGADKLNKLEATNRDLLIRVKNLETVVLDYGELYKNMSKKLDAMTLLMNQLPTTPQVTKPLFTSLFDSDLTKGPQQVSTDERNIIHAVRVEQLDCTSRENNVLLMGVIAPRDDLPTDQFRPKKCGRYFQEYWPKF